jgi:putative transposon-encoded protein
LVELYVESILPEKNKGVKMKLTVKDIHTYNNLVKKGEASPLGNSGQILVPRELDNEEVVLYDIASGDTFHPGENLIEKIKTTIDKALSG